MSDDDISPSQLRPSPWREYHRRQWTLRLLGLVFPIVVLTAGALTRSNAVAAAVALIWMALIWRAIVRLGNWKCPRCGENFRGNFSLGRACGSCSLALDDPPEKPDRTHPP
jgi:hypothetical protein